MGVAGVDRSQQLTADQIEDGRKFGVVPYGPEPRRPGREPVRFTSTSATRAGSSLPANSPMPGPYP